MRKANRIGLVVGAAIAALFAAQRHALATTYNGNGATGFGGPVGAGALTITDNAAGDVTLSFMPGAAHPSVDGNSLVIYLSTGATGITDTFPLSDNGDSGRRAISGYNYLGPDLDPTRSVIAFPAGFQATYALSMEGGFVGLFQLPPAGGDGGLTYVTGASQSGNPLSLTFPLASIGLSQGASFDFVGTLIDGAAAYRSNETIGATDPDIGAGGNPGFNNLITFSSALTYHSTVVGGASQWALATGGSWNNAANWTAGVPDAAGAAASLGASPGLTSSQTITLDGNRTVGTIRFDNAAASYTIAAGAGGTLAIDNTGGTAGSVAGISIVSGSHFISAPIQLAAGMTVNAAAGAQITLSGGVSGTGDLKVVGGGSVRLDGTNTYAGDTRLDSGATLVVAGSLPSTALYADGHVNFIANAGAGVLARSFSAINLGGSGAVTLAAPNTSAARTVLITGALNLAGSTGNWNGLIDLNANDLIVHGGNASTLRDQLKQGLGGVAGIASSAAAASASPRTGLGYAVITAAGTFDGQPVSAGDVVVKYTLVGDANLDSAVTFPDLVQLAQHYNGTNTLWSEGDFNYDGSTNFNDLVSLAQNYNKSLRLWEAGQLEAVGGLGFVQAFALAQQLVPEPSLAALALFGGALARRRRS